MKPQIETELKARLANRRHTETVLKKLGACYITKKHQIDYYFSPPHKSLVGKGLYFRVRHDALSGKSRLEYHKSLGKFTGEEYEIDISDHNMMLHILRLLEFKPEVVIDKTRDTYKLDTINIELDIVKELGNFIEIEILNHDRKEAEKTIFEMAKTLGIPEDDFRTTSYFNQMRAHSLTDKAQASGA